MEYLYTPRYCYISPLCFTAQRRLQVHDPLLLRHEYLVTENRILRHQLKGRLRLNDGERKALADIGQKLGKQALQEVATILGWHRKYVAQKCDGSKQRKAPGRPVIDQEVEALVVRMARRTASGAMIGLSE